MYPKANPKSKYDNNNYDVFPLVVTTDVPTTIHIRPLGGKVKFMPGQTYELSINAMDGGHPGDGGFPAVADFKIRKIVCNLEGGFDIEHCFDKEQEYYLQFHTEDGQLIHTFSIYCVDQDLSGRYPYIGDLHLHSNLSDGNETPEVVCANYHRYGYDFAVISDHRRYYPSLRAIEKYKDLPLEFTIVPGEEVHLPSIHGKTNPVHIVNFGGEYSINALTEGAQNDEVGSDPKFRSLNGICPAFMPKEEYEDKMQALADAAVVPPTVDALPYAVCCWIFDEIRRAGGLGIFAHPSWRIHAYHVPEAFQDYMFEQQPFDAFEVLGGERYFEHNGFQTVRYYEERAKGHRFPIVGSTDSHCSYPTNIGAYIASTIIFAPENERKALIAAVKDFYSVAVDCISLPEYRLVGEMRLVRYGAFLLKNYFPHHDELCYEEGRLMMDYVTGTEEEKDDAKRIIAVLSGRIQKQRLKYFDFQ